MGGSTLTIFGDKSEHLHKTRPTAKLAPVVEPGRAQMVSNQQQEYAAHARRRYRQSIWGFQALPRANEQSLRGLRRNFRRGIWQSHGKAEG